MIQMKNMLSQYMYMYRYRSVEECTMKRKETSKAKLFDFKVGCETELSRSVPPGTVVDLDYCSSPYCGRHGSALGTGTLDVFEGTDLILSAVLYRDLPTDR